MKARVERLVLPYMKFLLRKRFAQPSSAFLDLVLHFDYKTRFSFQFRDGESHMIFLLTQL